MVPSSTGCGCYRAFGVAVCLGWAAVRRTSKGRPRETVAAPVVPCRCCLVGLAPARTAAVWLSVWAARITGKPFTPPQTAVCSPSPSTLIHSALSPSSFLLLSFYIPCQSPCSLQYISDCYLPHFILCIPNPSVSPSPPPPCSFHFFFPLQPTLFFFQHTETQT